jgi:hypothetical protein
VAPGGTFDGYGCGSIQQAGNRIIVVEAVNRRPEGFDIIFMRTISQLSSIVIHSPLFTFSDFFL